MTNRDPVDAAVLRLPREAALKALDDIGRWLDHRRAIKAAHDRGAAVAPLYARPLSEQLLHEATRRARSDDYTWPVWDAYSARLRRLEGGDGDDAIS